MCVFPSRRSSPPFRKPLHQIPAGASCPSPMSDDSAEATLELTILSAEGLRHSTTFLGRSRPFAVAWVDPALKKTAKNLPSPDQKLHFPLSAQLLHDPNSAITVKILSARIPFRASKLVGSATMPLDSVPLAAGEPLVLPLYGPSGRPKGSVRVSARILWCLGSAQVAACVTGVPVTYTGAFVNVGDSGLYSINPMPLPVAGDVEPGGSAVLPLQPTAPPVPWDVALVPAEPESSAFLHVQLTAPQVLGDAETTSMEAEESGLTGVDTAAPLKPHKEERKLEGNNALRSFLVGLVSGSVASLLVGVARLSES